MPFELMPWDRKEYFKVMKEGRADSVVSEESREVTRCTASIVRKRPVDENDVTILKGVNLGRDLCDEESCQRNSQVPGNPSISATNLCNAYQSDSVRLSHLESASELEKRAFNGDVVEKLADGLQHSSNQCHESGLGRKPIRWTRSGSLSSYESGLSCSMSSKSLSVDFANSKVEVHRHNMNPSHSASGDTISCLTPTTPSEETSPWKRPRLKWGEGLAKFEKKSLVPDDMPNKSEIISCTSAQLSDCASPATPSSAVCCSFPGSDDKPFTKAAAVSNGNDSSQALVSENLMHPEHIPFNLEKVDLSVVIDAVPSLIKMINFDEKCSENSGSVSTSVMNKLLLLKSELLKAVDMTESEVDLLENELKSINNGSGHNGSPCLVSDSPAVEVIKESGQVPQSVVEVSLSHRPAMLLHEVTNMADSGNSEVLKADVDSAGRVTSKLVELPSIESGAVSGMINDGDCVFKFNAGSSSQEAQKSSKSTSHAGSSDSGSHMGAGENAVDSILASNREYTNKASEDLNIAYPLPRTIGGSGSDVRSEYMLIRKLFVKKKKALRFKEQAVVLKWRAMNSIWKDDMQLFSVLNRCSKAQKNLEICSQTTLNDRPSVRSKSLNVTKSSLSIMSKLLSSSHLKPCKSFLKMPALIMDDDEKRTCTFLSSNGLVEDPYGAEKERSLINAWSSEEREIFWDKLALHGKDFRKIACFLDHKSTADCVQFYYKNHKYQSFIKTKKQKDRKKMVKSLGNSTYLVTPAKKWDRVVDTASLDILGAASELVARNSERKENKKRSSCGLLLHSVGRTRRRKDVLFSQRPNEFRAAEHDIRTPDNEILPGACGSVSSEAVSSCITSSVNQGEVHCNETHKTFSILRKPPSIPEDVLIDDDEETFSDESSCKLNADYWTDAEKSMFVRAVQSYGKDFCMVSKCIRTKSKDQCKAFYSKTHKCLGLDIIHPDNDNEQQSVINDSNGDQSAPVPTSTNEAVPDVGDHKVSQRIHTDMSLSVSVTSNRDLQSTDLGMTSHACDDKSKEIENLEKPCANLEAECQIMDKSVSDRHMACVGSKPTMSNDNDKQTFQRLCSESTNKSVAIAPSPSFSAPFAGSLAQLGKERGLMESPLLHCHVGENGTSIEYVQNKASCLTDDCGTQKVPCRRSADYQPLVGITAGVPRQMYVSKGPVRGVTSQNRLAFRTSRGLLNPAKQHIAGLATPEISFARNSFEEKGRYFQGSHFAVNHVMQPTYVPSNQFNISQTFKKNVENNKPAWNLNFEDSTISRGSNSSYASIPQAGYVQKFQSMNSNPSVSDLAYFKPSSHCSRNQKINSVGPEKQGKQSNIKLFGQVLIPSTAPESPSLEETKLTQLPQMKGLPVDMNPPNHHSIFLGSENLQMRSFWDGRLTQTIPLLTGSPVPLSYGMSSSSVLGRQPLQMTVIPNVITPTVGSIFDNSLSRSVKEPQTSHATTTAQLDL